MPYDQMPILMLALTTALSPVDAHADARAYAVSYKPARDVYCIRFFSDTMRDPRPNTPAPTCMTRAKWARQGFGIVHRRR